MTRNYLKSSYSCKIVRSSSQGFVTTSQTTSTTFSVRMVKSSRQFVHDETFRRLHALCRSFKRQFRRTFTRLNNTFSPFIQHIKCFFQDDRQDTYQMLFTSFYETPSDVLNILSLIIPACLILRWKLLEFSSKAAMHYLSLICLMRYASLKMNKGVSF